MHQKNNYIVYNYKIVKYGTRNINFEEAVGKRESREYILPMQSQVTRKLKCHIIMICGGFHK